jgi:hypothetical protein
LGNPCPGWRRKTGRAAIASCVSIVVVLSSGCAGFSGAIAGAAVQGALLGAGLSPSYQGENWPFEDDPKSLQLKCGEEQIWVEVSPGRAILTIPDDVVELERDYTKPKQFRYFRMTRLPPEEGDLVVTEKGQDDFRTDWFVLLSDGLAELGYGDMTKSCIVERQETAS